jgi:hypothetical protein
VVRLGVVIACSAADRTASGSGSISPIADRDKIGTTAEVGRDGLSQTETLYLLTDLAFLKANSPGLARGNAACPTANSERSMVLFQQGPFNED